MRAQTRVGLRGLVGLALLVGLVLIGAAVGSADTPTPQSAAASAFASFAVKSDGTLWSWGGNQYGQLGLSDTKPRAIPTQVGLTSDWATVSAREWNTFAIKTDGTLWVCGTNLGSVADTSTFVQMGSAHWRVVSLGLNHTMGVQSDGTLWAWGSNESGQLGIPGSPGAAVPAKVGTESDWTTVTATMNHTLALKSNGTLWAWGDNSRGQLGTGGTTSHNAPTQVAGTWIAISAGPLYSVGVKSDGSLWVWGDDVLGQLGDGLQASAPLTTPRRLGTASDWAGVSACAMHTVALKRDGEMWVWGWSNSGELGTSDVGTAKTPRQIGAGHVWTAVAGGPDHTLGVTNDDAFGACGQNFYGQTGIGYPNYRNVPEQLGVAGGWTQTDAGLAHAGAVRADGSLWMWGRNSNGESGIDGVGNSPARVGTENDWRQVRCGDEMNGGFTVALKTDGTLWSWGANALGQLGVGDTTDRSVPKQIGSASTWTTLTVSDGVGPTGRTIITSNSDFRPHGFVLALRSDGSLYAWGDNSNGQLGTGSHVSHSGPVHVGSWADHWRAVAAGDNFSIGIKTDGTIWGWGSDWNNQLNSDVATADILTPHQLSGSSGKTWRLAACTSGRDYANVVAITDDGQMWGWGVDGNYLGIYGGAQSGPQPSRLGTDSDWTELGAGSGFGDNFLIARKADGTLWSSGSNFRGVLGQGDYVGPRTVLTRIGSETDTSWASLGVGTNAFAIKTNGTLWAWGDDSYGALGLGDPEFISTPNTFQLVSEVDTTAPYVIASPQALVVAAVGISGDRQAAAVSEISASEKSRRSPANLALSATSADIWYRTSVKVNLSASDAGMGVSRKQYSTNGGIGWLTGNYVTVTRNGTTTVKYRAIDRVGNKSAVQARVVHIDKVKPKPYAYSNLSVRRYHYLTFKFKVSDICPTVTTYVKIYTTHGRLLKTYTLKAQRPNVWKTLRAKISLKRGYYKWRVYAKDLAGNVQTSPAVKRLRVK